MNTSLLLRTYPGRAVFFQIAKPVCVSILAALGAAGCCPRSAPSAGDAAKGGVATLTVSAETSAKPAADEDGRQRSTRVTIDFPGGTLGDLRKYLPVPPNEPFNLIVSDEFAALALPAFSVRDADSSALANALTHHLYSQGVKIELMNYVQNGTAVYVTYSDPASVGNTFYDRNGDLLFQCEEMDAESAARLAEAMRSAWSTFYRGDSVPATLRYHEATQQLFVSGPRPALDVFNAVLQSIRSGPPAARQP